MSAPRVTAWDPVTLARTMAVDFRAMSSSVSCSSVVAQTRGAKHRDHAQSEGHRDEAGQMSSPHTHTDGFLGSLVHVSALIRGSINL